MHSLRVKLLAPFILGMLALAMMLSWYTYTSARQTVQDTMLLISEGKTNHTASSMTLLFKSVSTSIQNLVTDHHATSIFTEAGKDPAVRAKTADWLTIITQGNEYYRDIVLVNRRGICIASSNPGHIGESYAEKPYVNLALNGSFTFGDSGVGRVTKNLSIVTAGPIDVMGEIKGALLLFNDFPKIVDYDAKAEYDAQTVFTAMLSPNGMFEAHKNKRLMGSDKQLFPQLYRELAQVGEQGAAVTYTLMDQKYVGYAKLEPATKWVVVTSGLEEEVFASAYKMRSIVLGINATFLCLIAFLVVRFANGILTTLIALIAYAKDVSEGHFEKNLGPSKRKDELGILHKSLQRLVEALRSMLEETKEASKLKSEFLANMSHEIRTPLNAIIGMVHLSLRDGGLPEKQRDYLNKIQIAAKSLLGVINDILDLSKVEAGMLCLESRPFNLRETIDNSLSIYQQNADSKELYLTVDYPNGMPENFIGDPLRIGQVLNNLLSNAIKFTTSGGLTIRCGYNFPTGDTADARGVIHVSVTDTGIGMDEEALAGLFQPFTQADASISRRFGGTGLGLAISNRLVQLFNGEFTVVSTLGKGTTFSFSMRLEQTTAQKTQEANVPLTDAFEQLNLNGKAILVAEDNAINQLIIQEMIAPSGAAVTIAENGLEAFEAVKAKEYDLVFMDMQMPVMDGLTATRRIREHLGDKKLPIIAATANAMQEDREKGLASGMNDYITKPIEPQELIKKLRVWLCDTER